MRTPRVARRGPQPSPRPIPGCTIGAKVLEPGRWAVLFKNKDFKRSTFEDDILVEENLFGVRGIVSWDSLSGESDRFSGLSAGMNSERLLCADANIKTLARKRNYDELTEFVLRNGRRTKELQGILSAEIRSGYGRTNMVAADVGGVCALEVGADVRTEASGDFVTRTNHFLLTPGAKIDYHENAGTKTRFSDSRKKLAGARGLSDIFDLLKTHRSMEMGNSICNHGTIHTVYSYVFEVKDGRSTLHVCQGPPCENSYVAIDLPFPLKERAIDSILERYPSRRLRGTSRPATRDKARG